jgi:hypothetical protein
MGLFFTFEANLTLFFFSLMGKIYLFGLYLLLFPPGHLQAQDKDDKSSHHKKEKREKKKKEKKVPENIEVIPKVFAFRPKYVLPSTIFDVTNRDGKGLRFNYIPFIQGVVGAGIKIKSVYVSYSMTLPTTTAQEQHYGKTTFYDIGLTIQTRITGIDLFYQDYKGYYLLNPEKYYPGWSSEMANPQKHNLHTTNAGMNLSFVTNHNFSPNAAFAQSERQKTSRGAFIIGITERFTRIANDSSIVPATEVPYFPTLNKLRLGNFYSSILSLGLGYSFVHKNFSITPVLLGGSGLLAEDYQLTDGSRIQFKVPVYADFKMALGYNGNHFYTNIILNAELNSLPLEETRLRMYHGSVEFGLGVRF